MAKPRFERKTPEHRLQQCDRYRAKVKADPVKAERKREYMRLYRLRNLDKINARQRERQHERRKLTSLQRKKIALEHLERVEAATTCDICGGPGDGRWKSLAVDHCHKTNRFRGMLCFQCNSGLGKFKDDPDLLRKALAYLQAEC